jgi:hypothetical protein
MVNNAKGPGPYWFPAKTYGWGWGLPVTWQGCLVLATYTVLMIASSILFPPDSNQNASILSVATLSAVLVIVCWLTGEPPRWRWGIDD